MVFHTVVMVVLMVFHAFVRNSEIAVTTVVKIFLIPSHSPTKNSDIAFQAVVMASPMACHA